MGRAMTTEQTIRNQIGDLAGRMVDGTVDLVDGCRAIVRLRGSLPEPDLSDADLLVLVAVESELDVFPDGSARQHWSSEALAAKDKEQQEYILAARPEILRVCRALHARWGRG
jgi:hypothetical protein